MEEICGGEYQIIKKIGQGSFGKIYIVKQVKTGLLFAAKLENSDAPIPQLLFESRLYQIMSGSTNVPRLHAHSFDSRYNTIVIDLLGKSLEEHLNKVNRRMSLKTVLMLVDQMITAVEFFHSKNYIHRDIKPDNFVMGVNQNSNKLYIIDYGLAKKYRDVNTHEHIPYIEGKSLTGTARYASINALLGCEQSRRDDMEAIGYVIVYLLKGHLPWMGIDGATNQERYRRIAECKRDTPLEKLCEGLPSEIITYIRKVRSLRFTERPHYASYRRLFRGLFRAMQFTFDYIYDWSPRKDNDVPPVRYTRRKGQMPVNERRPSIEAVFSGERRRRSEENMRTIDFENEEIPEPKKPVEVKQIELSSSSSQDKPKTKPNYMREIDAILNRVKPVQTPKIVSHLPPPPIEELPKKLRKEEEKTHHHRKLSGHRTHHHESKRVVKKEKTKVEEEEEIIPKRFTKRKELEMPSDDEPLTSVDEFLIRRGLMKPRKPKI